MRGKYFPQAVLKPCLASAIQAKSLLTNIPGRIADKKDWMIEASRVVKILRH
jgi:hypothetical protein